MVVANLTYIVHKDVLSDMISRLAHVKRIKLQGSPDGATGFGPLEQLGVLYSISLCFPRITMAWRYLNGQPLAPAGSCCHQECHWEELFKVGLGSSMEVCNSQAGSRFHGCCGMVVTANLLLLPAECPDPYPA
jgi:hypothetical protein